MKRQDKLNEAWCKYRGKCSTEIMQALAFALRWCDENPMPMSEPPIHIIDANKKVEHTLQRDKDGFLVGEVSDLDVYLPFEVHDNKDGTWVLIEDSSALVDWSGDIDKKPRYDKIRTTAPVVSNSVITGKKGGKEC